MNFSNQADTILLLSLQEAHRTGHRTVLPGHILLAVLRLEGNAALQTLKLLGADVKRLKKRLDEGLMRDALPFDEEISVGKDAYYLLERAQFISAGRASDCIDSCDLLLTLSLSEDISQDAARLLREEGADFGKIKEYLDDNPGIRGPEYADPGRESGQLELMLNSLARRLSSSGTEKKTPAS